MSKPRTPEQKEKRKAYERDWARRKRLRCRDAVNARQREKYALNPTAKRVAATTWYQRHKHRIAERLYVQNVRRKYGLTAEQYAALGKTCHICGTATNNRAGHRLHVDHCHDTGKVRGMLCHSCNTGIGGLKHDVTLMKKAIEYLERE